MSSELKGFNRLRKRANERKMLRRAKNRTKPQGKICSGTASKEKVWVWQLWINIVSTLQKTVQFPGSYAWIEQVNQNLRIGEQWDYYCYLLQINEKNWGIYEDGGFLSYSLDFAQFWQIAIGIAGQPRRIAPKRWSIVHRGRWLRLRSATERFRH